MSSGAVGSATASALPAAMLTPLAPYPSATLALAALENVVDMLRNFAFYLQRQGLLQHTLLLTTDEG